MMEIRVALVKTARFGFMKQGVQFNYLPKAKNLALWNLNQNSMLPAQTLFERISLSMT